MNHQNETYCLGHLGVLASKIFKMLQFNGNDFKTKSAISDFSAIENHVRRHKELLKNDPIKEYQMALVSGCP